jgi:2-keto-4-pentenoate hydratase/2-oxohepta-3-ene-1,7-dioic acid hydratase in catechol pathway
VRLLTFTESAKPSSKPRIGVLRDDGRRVVDLGAAALSANLTLPFDSAEMVELIAAGPDALRLVADLGARPGNDLALSDLTLYAPIPKPRKNVFCVGWNYLEHFEEGAAIRKHVAEMPAYPTFFTKAPTTVIGPYDGVPFFTNLSSQLDWEVEMCLVIGAGGRDISEADAMRHVFGYAVLNDVSWRDIQRRHGQQWFKGKSVDATCPWGPWITTADQVDPANLKLTCRVNGEVKQHGSTAQMYFKIPRIIAELSAGLTLEPGDLIATGTPPGVGHARTPPEFMKVGDILETEVESLGSLRNTIVAL